MGTYTKSTVGRTARPRSERLRRLGGVVGVASSVSEYGPQAEMAVFPDWFLPVTVNDEAALKLNPKYAGLFADGWLAAGGIGQGGSGGGGLISSVKGVADLNTPIASESLTETFSAYAIQSIYNSVRLKSAVALSNVLPYASGRVRVATLTIDGTNHDIYAPEPTGGGGVETETDPIFSASAAFGISATDIANWDAKYDKPSGGIPKTDLASAVQTSLGKADTALQSETDPVYSAWIGTSRTKNTVFAAPSNANGTPSFRALVASDIPSLTISKISDAETWISGKGYVTKTGTDTISGAKTFTTNDVILSGVSLLPATDDTGSFGIGGRRFNSANIRNIYTSYFEFRDGTTQARTGNIGFDIGLGSITITNNNADYQYRFYAPGGGNGLFFQPATGQTQHVPLGKSDHRWTKIWGEEGDYSGALTLSGASNTTRRIYFGDTSHYLELDQYGFHFSHGVYSDDFVSAGGIGNGGGSGSATELGDLVDVALTSRSNGDLLVYNSATSHWENKPQSSIIPTVSVSFADLTSHPTTLAGYGITDAKIANGVITLGGNTITPLTSFTETDPTVPAWAKAENKPPYSLSEISGTGDLQAIEALTGTGFLKRTASNTWALDNTSYLPLAGGTVTGAMEFLGSLAGPIESGTTRYWRIDNDGTAVFDSVSVMGLSIGGAYIDFDNFVTLSGAQTISGVKTFSGGITMSGANILTSADSTNSIGASGTRFLAGHIRNIYTTYLGFMSDNGLTQRGNIGMGEDYASINFAGTPSVSYHFFRGAGFFHSGNGAVPCGRSDHRWSEVWAVDADLSGDLSLSQASHIDIGPVRLEYANEALHITTNDATNHPNIGAYADGFVAAGGIGSGNASVKYVTCTQVEYNAMTKDPATLYLIGSPVSKVCLGSITLYSET